MRESSESSPPKPAVVLLGAGCSYSANVLLASEVVEYVRVHHNSAYRAAHDKKLKAAKSERERRAPPSYPEVMLKLNRRARDKLFLQIIEHSTLNRSHAALGYLVRGHRIGRVLTTNFDDLVVRGCAFQGVFPPVYDLGMLGELRGDDEQARFVRHALKTIEPAIFHLHGRHNVPYQIHSTREAEAQKERLRPIVEALRDRLWIVAGYSGDSDPLWDTLRRVLVGKAPARMCWVNIAPPTGAPRRDLENAGGVFVESDTDAFFATLANMLPPVEKRSLRSTSSLDLRGLSRWLAHPRAEADALSKNLHKPYVSEAAKHLEPVRKQLEDATQLLNSHAPRPVDAWRRLSSVLAKLNPKASQLTLKSVVHKRPSLSVSPKHRREFEQETNLLRVRRSGVAGSLRTEAFCACARAFELQFDLRGELLDGAVQLQDDISEALHASPTKSDLSASLAAVLLVRCRHDAARQRGEREGLLRSARHALKEAFSALPGADPRRRFGRSLSGASNKADFTRRRAQLEDLLRKFRAST